MAGLPRAPSKRKYSWWWDSHISPKNSKWLQENLTDMDAKVKAMIKLIEEDADSFARRAEMYYKKRPELMKLVEEFYRAYRALAERYDNATSVLRQAHSTMAEEFPIHVSLGISDNSPENAASEMGPQTPDIPPPLHALSVPDHLQKGTKQMGEGRVRKGLNFHDSEGLYESGVVINFEKEIQTLKDALAKLEAEKDAGLTEYEQSFEKLNKLESEVSHAQQDSREFKDRANKAEGEVQALKVSLIELDAEKEVCFLEYQKCLKRIANLENDVSQAKEEVGELNKLTRKAESEKDEVLHQYKQSLEMISDLENKLKLAEEDARQLNECADNAEKEVETLKQALAKLTQENESSILKYRQCLEKIMVLDNKLSCTQEEVQWLKQELDSGVTKLKGAEELCISLEKLNQSLNAELGSLVLKMGSQSDELTEKQKELAKLWTCLQEERFRFGEAETAFQTLQHLHSQTREQLRSLALELENKDQLLRDTETRNDSLLDEIMKVNEENKSLNECNISSSISIKEMQNEISGLVESRGKLAEEVGLRVDQRNALQQEIYRLKEDLNELNKINQIMLEQVDAVGLSPENFESSVQQLQTENSDLKETSEKERAEKTLLLKKLAIAEQLLEKNALLEKSLLDLTAELEGARGKINVLEQSLEALVEEKSMILAEKTAVTSQLQVMIKNLEKNSEKNNCLENSLSDACRQLDGLKARSKTLEDSCQLLEKEKTYLTSERDALVSQGKTIWLTLEALEGRQRDLGDRYSGLEKERESTFFKLEQLRLSLDVEKKEHDTFAQRTETQLEGMAKQNFLLQEEVFSRRREFGEELDKAMNYQLKIFILQRCVEDLKEKNSSLLAERQKLVEASKLSEKLISELKHDNLGRQVEVKSLSDQASMFKMGMCELSKALGIELGHGFKDVPAEDQKYLHHMLCKLEDDKNSLHQVLDENQQLDVEMLVTVTLLGQLWQEAKELNMERDTLDKKLKIRNELLILSQNEANKLLESNGDLNLKVSELTSLVVGLNREIDEANVVSNNWENEVHKLSNNNIILVEENLCLNKEKMELALKMRRLHEEFGLATQRWESEATAIFEELQYSTIFRSLLEEKLYELKDRFTLKDAQIEKRIGTLEGEHGGLRAQLDAYSPLVMSLKDSISSLENRTMRANLQKSHSKGAKEVSLVSSKNWNADHEVLNIYSELKDLNYRVKVIEKAVVQKETLMAQESKDANSKLEAAMKNIDDLKFRGCLNREYSVPMSDNSEFESEISMKDIVLDVNSESSPYEFSRQGEKKSQSKMVESLNSSDVDHCIDLAYGRIKMMKPPPSELLKRRKGRRLSSEIATEKELGVEKLEILRTLSQRGLEANKNKILERFKSDAQKLMNLQITVQDLMKKVEITEQGKRGKAVYAHETLREQLEEAEEAIIELLDYNSKLMRRVEKRSFSSNIKLGVDAEESGSTQRRRIAEQARKVAEKIRRLRLEVQKIQFVLVKIDDENKKSKGRSRIMEMKRGVLLRDYLYGGLRTPSHQLRKKRSAFCGCVQPST